MPDSRQFKTIAPLIVFWCLAALVGITDSLWVGYTVYMMYGPWVFVLSLLCFGVLTSYFMNNSLTEAFSSFGTVMKDWFKRDEYLLLRWVLALVAITAATLFVFYLYHSSMVQTYNLLTVKLHMVNHLALVLSQSVILPAMVVVGAMMAYDFVKLIEKAVEHGFFYRWLLKQPRTLKAAGKSLCRLVLTAGVGVLAFLVAAITTTVFINGFMRFQAMFKFIALPQTGPQTLLFIALFLISTRLLMGAAVRISWGLDKVIDRGVANSVNDLHAHIKGMTWQEIFKAGFLSIAIPFRAFFTGKFFSTQAGSPLGANPHMVSGTQVVADDFCNMPIPAIISDPNSPSSHPQPKPGASLL